jgi:Kef-type K+ transport system membrane component KefB
VTDHQLFLFLLEVTALVVAARAGGEVASRLGAPEVVGELAAGVLLGPSVFGLIWPGAFAALFPYDPDQRQLLEAMAWIGVIFLVLNAGMETRLGVIRHAGRTVAYTWMGAFCLPFVAGLGLGLLVPEELWGPSATRIVFALFLAIAMSISAIPVIARILIDTKLVRTKLGTLIISSAVADDTVGWILLAAVIGLASGTGLTVWPVVRTLLLTALFIALAFTVGQAAVRWAIRGSARLRIPYAQTSITILMVLVGAIVTQAIGVHLVLGAFVMAILIGRTWPRERVTIASIRFVGMGFFVPFFFAYTGIKADFALLTGAALWVAVAALAVACLSKLVGGSLGARLGGVPGWEAVAVGVGLNARGAMELVIAAIGLSLGILSDATYATLILIAIVTSVMAAPLLASCVRRGRAAGSPDSFLQQAPEPDGASTRAETEGL